MKRNLAAILLTLFFLSGCGPEEERVPAFELERINYLFYYNNKLFTGVSFEMWSPTQLHFETHWKDGKSHGVFKEWDEDGKLIKKATWKNGELKSEKSY